MLLSGLLSCLLLFQGGVKAFATLDKRFECETVDDFAAVEYPIALAGLYANIGPSGSKSSGAAAGVVIASPSTVDPDYLYTWIRDSSLVFKYIIDRYVSGRDPSLATTIDQWVASMGKIQQVTNPSGSVTTGGLGEPKFMINETQFTDAWGRPQRDGPALRSTAMITYANHLLSQGDTDAVRDTLWPYILLDLNYVSHNWNQTTFDLWEEVKGGSFFTTAVQHRALRQGIILASALNDPAGTVGNWTAQADNIYCFLQTYWSPTGGFISANVNGKKVIRSGIDANTVITSIHTFDPSAGCDSRTFQPCSDKALSNLKVYVDSFRSIYPINNGTAANAGVATGRYAEDVYYNGNPWYLTTMAVSEQLYRAIQVWDTLGKGIDVTSISLAFFQQFNPDQVVGNIPADSAAYATMKAAIKTFADQTALVAAKYVPASGALSEQFLRSNGTATSARDLTWSYAAALTMFDARAGYSAESWGSGSLTVPPVCYGGGNPNDATVIFNITAYTLWGENIYLTGSIDALSNWSTDDALGPLTNTDTYPVWIQTVGIPANTTFQYKYIRKFNGTITWESDPNRNATSGAARTTLELDDIWR